MNSIPKKLRAIIAYYLILEPIFGLNPLFWPFFKNTNHIKLFSLYFPRLQQFGLKAKWFEIVEKKGVTNHSNF